MNGFYRARNAAALGCFGYSLMTHYQSRSGRKKSPSMLFNRAHCAETESSNIDPNISLARLEPRFLNVDVIIIYTSAVCIGVIPTLYLIRMLLFQVASTIRDRFQTPVYVYDERTLRQQAASALAFPNSFGLTVRFAIKACPNAAILKVIHNSLQIYTYILLTLITRIKVMQICQLFHSMGVHFDASSGYEAMRAIRAGIPPSHIR